MSCRACLKLSFNFTCFIDEFLYDSGPNGANDVAMKKLLVRYPPSALLKRRVSKGTDLRICSIIKEKVETLFLFDESYSINEYENFIKTTKLDKDPDYRFSESNPSTPNFALYVKDIAGAAADGRLIKRFKSVTRLIYFGTQSSDGNHILDKSWHNNMHLVVQKLPKLKSLVVNRFGHFEIKPSLQLQNMLATYDHLISIHLVQPHESAIRAISTCDKFQLTEAYNYMKADSAQDKVVLSFNKMNMKDATVVYIYYMKN